MQLFNAFMEQLNELDEVIFLPLNFLKLDSIEEEVEFIGDFVYSALQEFSPSSQMARFLLDFTSSLFPTAVNDPEFQAHLANMDKLNLTLHHPNPEIEAAALCIRAFCFFTNRINLTPEEIIQQLIKQHREMDPINRPDFDADRLDLD